MASSSGATLNENQAITRSGAARIRNELRFEVVEAAVDPLAGERPRAARTRPTAIANSDVQPSPHFRFLDLSPELRNKIYEYVVVSPEPVEIAEGVKDIPGIVHANRQIFFESQTIFLADNEFILMCEDADISPLCRFMRALDLFNNPTRLAQLGPLTIFCHGFVFPSQEWNPPFTYPDPEDWQRWESNLQKLQATGLAPEQLIWLAWLPVKQDGGRTLGWDEFGPGEAGAIKFIFHNYFLEFLMKEVRYFDTKPTPQSAAVYKQVKEDWEVLGLEEDAASEMENHLAEYCSERELIYITRQEDLVQERNKLVEKVIDKTCQTLRPVEPLALALQELVEFDLRHGAAIHRDPVRTTRLHNLLVAEAKRLGERLSPESTVIQQVQMTSIFENEGDTEEDAIVARKSDADLDKLHDEQGMVWRVEEYVRDLDTPSWDRPSWIMPS
ncbi:hypothetical protein M409DRAFT_28038 [Zasmidium cellare ATCC 36951]|uniref:Uncharacterized protein n=1 Tax=Zasmidium cellare ATCC 36951 TaxID=1080233 RepID=A0A6A6C3Z0_ZASCE|nr:uncharacterized protein M409DRAFT_28038 [Zasmidium cellare ATCC 36951]KAF2161643.1 hypothetical protein M409DRAFT_28038 [Zasmidium cellare ATCC 36951]